MIVQLACQMRDWTLCCVESAASTWWPTALLMSRCLSASLDVACIMCYSTQQYPPQQRMTKRLVYYTFKCYRHMLSKNRTCVSTWRKPPLSTVYRLCRLMTILNLVVQGHCGITPNKLQQFWSLLFHVLWGPSTTKKSPRDSEWRFSNYQGSKVKVSQSETRIQMGQ